MVVPFSKARPGDEAFVFTTEPGDEYGWVTDRAYFDDIDDPVTVKRQLWQLVSEETVTFHHDTELCPTCHGEGVIQTYELPHDTCPDCKGDGGHPLAGQMEIKL